MRIALDPGHGGSDPGAVSRGYQEKDIALQITRKLRLYLVIDYAHEVMFTRPDDRYVGLTERCQMANRWGADLFVSIHLNADPDADEPGMKEARGAEIWVYPAAKRSRQLAESVATAIKGRFPDEPFRGVKEDDLAVLRMTKMPALLIECGFIDNSDTVRRLSDEGVQLQLGKAIADGIQMAVG